MTAILRSNWVRGCKPQGIVYYYVQTYERMKLTLWVGWKKLKAFPSNTLIRGLSSFFIKPFERGSSFLPKVVDVLAKSRLIQEFG